MSDYIYQNTTAEPPAHQHGPDSVLQSYPVSGHKPPHCPPPTDWGQACAPQPPACSPVPPPIPPVQYVPGLDVQDQLINMANRVNTAVNRWNEIQANCYRALDQVVGAAVNNDVYYAPDEVRYMEGYSEDAGCPYSIVEAKAVDRAGRPIFCHLRAAYNNETNSGAQENIQDVSFVTSAQVVMTAFQATENRWNGTTIFNSNPGNSVPDDTIWVAGWNRNGVLRFFQGDVSQDVLRQNRMVNCIGPVFPILQGGNVFEQVVGSMGETAGTIQAMGWKNNGNKVFFSVGSYDAPGMTPMQVAKVMQGIGCMTAVITSYMTKPATGWDTIPIAGTENVIPQGGESRDVISAPGLTGGLTYLGKLVNAPLQWNIPANAANWVITKRPQRGWHNAFTTEVANVVQKLGSQENSMNSLLGQMKDENSAISELQYNVQKNADNISELQVIVGGFDTRISTLETGLEKANANIAANAASIDQLNKQLEAEIQLRDTQYQTVTQAIQQETNERIAQDNVLNSKIAQEASARESQDRILQNNINSEASIRESEDNKLKAEIDTEATTRAAADRNLQAAIEAEASARSTKDTQHEAMMDAITAKEQQDVSRLEGQIEDLENGKTLPIASTTQLGVFKVGKNLTIASDGTLDAVGGASGGGTIVAGPGITVTENTAGDKVVGIDESVVVNEDELATQVARISKLETAQVDQAAKDQLQDQKISALETEDTELQAGITKNEKAIEAANTEIAVVKEATEQSATELDSKLADITKDVEAIQSGAGLPIASADTLGAFKVGANLSISEDGTLSATGGEGGSGETVAQGAGISVTHNTETGVATVALNAESQAAIAAVADKADQSALVDLRTDVLSKASQADLDALTTTVAGKADKAALQPITEQTYLNKTNIENLSTQVVALDPKVNKNTTDIGSLNSSVLAQGNKLDTAVQNLDAVVTEQTAIKDEQEQLKKDLQSVDDTATQAISNAADAEAVAQQKVAKEGDTMTGPLVMQQSNIAFADSDGNVMGRILPGSETGVLMLGGRGPSDLVTLTGLANPNKSAEAANKNYVDNTVQAVVETANEAATAATEASAAATAAQGTANSAKTTADQALAKANSIVPGISQAQGDERYLKLSGGTMTGTLDVGGQLITGQKTSGFGGRLGVGSSVGTDSYIRLSALSPISQFRFNKSGGNLWLDAMSNAIEATISSSVRVSGISTPTQPYDAANKLYVDSSVAEVSSPIAVDLLSIAANGTITKVLGTYKSAIIFSAVYSSLPQLLIRGTSDDLFMADPAGSRWGVYSFTSNGDLRITNQGAATNILLIYIK